MHGINPGVNDLHASMSREHEVSSPGISDVNFNNQILQSCFQINFSTIKISVGTYIPLINKRYNN